MLTDILLLMIGIKLNMGTAYYVLLGICAIINTIGIMIKLYLKGKESNDISNKF